MFQPEKEDIAITYFYGFSDDESHYVTHTVYILRPPESEKHHKYFKTLDLLFKLEKNMTAQVAAILALVGLIQAYILSVLHRKLIPHQLKHITKSTYVSNFSIYNLPCPDYTYMRQRPDSSLIQTVPVDLLSIESRKQNKNLNFSEILIEIQTFSLNECKSKCRLRSGGHFVWASMCEYHCFSPTHISSSS